MNCSHMSFYLFKGDWQSNLAEVINMVEIQQRQLIALWTPRDKSKKHNLLILPAELPQEFCVDKSIWKTNENVFASFYEQNVKKYNVYNLSSVAH